MASTGELQGASIDDGQNAPVAENQLPNGSHDLSNASGNHVHGSRGAIPNEDEPGLELGGGVQPSAEQQVNAIKSVTLEINKKAEHITMILNFCYLCIERLINTNLHENVIAVAGAYALLLTTFVVLGVMLRRISHKMMERRRLRTELSRAPPGSILYRESTTFESIREIAVPIIMYGGVILYFTTTGYQIYTAAAGRL